MASFQAHHDEVCRRRVHATRRKTAAHCDFESGRAPRGEVLSKLEADPGAGDDSSWTAWGGAAQVRVRERARACRGGVRGARRGNVARGEDPRRVASVLPLAPSGECGAIVPAPTFCTGTPLLYKRASLHEEIVHTFSAFWLRSSVVSVLISVIRNNNPLDCIYHNNLSLR